MADERAPAENFNVRHHPLEQELKTEQEEIKKARQTYLDLVEKASKYHSYLFSLLSMYNFSETANNAMKAQICDSNPRTVTKVVRMESEVPIETPPQIDPVDKYVLEKYMRFEQFLDRLFVRLANSGDVADVQSIKENICENVKKQIQSIRMHCKIGHDKLFEEFLRNETQQFTELLESKDLCIKELQARVNQLQQEKEELTNRVAALENSNEVDQIREELKRKHVPVRKLQKKSDDAGMSSVDDQHYLFTEFIDEETVYDEAKDTENSGHYENVSNYEESVPQLEKESSSKNVLVSSNHTTRLPETRDESQLLKNHNVFPYPSKELRVVLQNVDISGLFTAGEYRQPSCNIDGTEVDGEISKPRILRKRFICAKCYRCFRKKSSLITHLRGHNNKHWLECKSCHKLFTRKYDFDLHSRIHSAPKLFSCSICDKAFSKKYNLSLHQKAHRKKSSPKLIESHKCNICQKNYTRKGWLKRHRHNTTLEHH